MKRMRKNYFCRFVSLFLTLTLVLGAVPVSLAASNPLSDAYMEILSFEPLDDSIRYQSVPLGTSLEELNLPTYLWATIHATTGSALTSTLNASGTGYGSGGRFLSPIEPPIVGSIPISTRIELESIADNPSGNFHLVNDINLADREWTPIGYDWLNAFTGIFDGQGFIVRNLTITGQNNSHNGLFGYTVYATVKNVGMEDTYINVVSNAGSIIASAFTSDIINSFNTGTVFSETNAGGLVGTARDGLIAYSYNLGNVSTASAESSAGGILGAVDGFAALHSVVTINNSFNSGAISANGDFSIAGGLIGHANFAAIIVNDSHNAGIVTSEGTAGGICGLVSGSSRTAYARIVNGFNSGRITAFNTAGGVLGRSFIANVTIDGSYNSADVTATIANFGNAGGIIGSGESTNFTITNCNNSGTITGSDAGGIGGQVTNIFFVSNSHNTGSVFGESSTGGIFGLARHHSYGAVSFVYNCSNTGDITAMRNHPNITGIVTAGGIIGSFGGSGTIFELSNSFNTGDVFASSYVVANTSYAFAGGIVGTASRATINQTFSTGAVSADSISHTFQSVAYAGGIGGRVTSGISLSNSYNRGNVSAQSFSFADNQPYRAYAGGIAGQANRIDAVYNTGMVSATLSRISRDNYATYIGGISGRSDDTDEITNSYSLDLFNSRFGVQLTPAQMRDSSYLVGFDFVDVWQLSAQVNDGFPALRWQPEDDVDDGLRIISVNSPGNAVISRDLGRTVAADVPMHMTYVEIDLIVTANATWRLYNDFGLTEEFANRIMPLPTSGINFAHIIVSAADEQDARYLLAVTRITVPPAISNPDLTDMFRQDSIIYNHQLAQFAAELSALAYGRDENNSGAPISRRLTDLGFSHDRIRQFNYGASTMPDYHNVAFTLAHQNFYIDGAERNVIMVVIRGTHGDEWHSNFYVGTGIIHYGFNRATERVLAELNTYMNDLASRRLSNPNTNIIFITGHSRGAAVANLLAADLNRVQSLVHPNNLFTYTFATPNTTRNPVEYRNIFNFVNAEDFVTFVPLTLSGWGFWKHGRTYAFPSRGLVNSGVFNRHEANVVREYRGLTGSLSPNIFFRDGFNRVADTVFRMHDLAESVHDYYNELRQEGVFSRITPREFFRTVAGAATGSMSDVALLGGHAVNPISDFRHLARFFVGEGFQHGLPDPMIVHPHDENIYRAWIQAIDGYNDLLSGQLRSRRLRIACPVDVAIYDSDGRIIGRVVNDEITVSSYDVLIVVDEDVKYIYTPIFETFTVRITATDSGTMTYTIEDFDVLPLEVIDAKEFVNVQLHEGLEMISEISDTPPEIRLLIVENGEIVGEVLEDGTIIGIDTMYEGVFGDNFGNNTGDNMAWVFNPNTGLLTISGTGGWGEWKLPQDAPWHDFRSEITAVIIADSVTEIGFMALANTRITSVEIPDSVTIIGNASFMGCSELVSVIIGSGVETIFIDAFFGCTGIVSITIPPNVANIFASAFGGNTSLVSVEFLSATPPFMGGGIFWGSTALTTIYVPIGASAAYVAIEQLQAFNIVEVGGRISTELRFVIDSATFSVNGTNAILAHAPFMRDGGAFIPLREIVELMGGMFEWVTANQLARITIGNEYLLLPADEVLPGGDAPPVVEVGRMFVPVRFISDIFDTADASWDATTQAIYVTFYLPVTINVPGDSNVPEDITLRVFVDGEQRQTGGIPFVHNGRTMIPVCEVVRAIGGTFNWITVNQTARIGMGTQSLTLSVNNILPGGDGAPVISSNQMFVPVRFLTDAFGGTADWNASTQTVYLNFTTPIRLLVTDGNNQGDNVDTGNEHGQSNQGGGWTPPPPRRTVAANNGAVNVAFTISQGVVTLSLPTNIVTQLISNAVDGRIIFDLTSVTEARIVQMPTVALTRFASAELYVEIRLPQGTIILGADSAASVAYQAGNNIRFSVNQLSISDITEVQRRNVRDGDVIFEITITSDNQTIRDFEGTITVTVSDASLLPAAVWHLDEYGELHRVEITYCAETETITPDPVPDPTLDTITLPWANPFTDVHEGDWFFSSVRFAHQNNLFGGTSATTFSPNMTMTRGMMVTVLHRMAGTPQTGSAAFADVADNVWYANAVNWAAANGIVSGFGDGRFGPGDDITREQMASILYRYAAYVILELPQTRIGAFNDEAQIGDWALHTVNAMFNAGVISGRGDGYFVPQGSATRAEVAALLRNFMEATQTEPF